MDSALERCVEFSQLVDEIEGFDNLRDEYEGLVSQKESLVSLGSWEAFLSAYG